MRDREGILPKHERRCAQGIVLGLIPAGRSLANARILRRGVGRKRLPVDGQHKLTRVDADLAKRAVLREAFFRGAIILQPEGIKTGDKIVAVNGVQVPYFHLLQAQLQALKGKTALLSVNRGSDTLAIAVPVSDEGTIGFQVESLLNFTTVDYTLGQALVVGTQDAFGVVYNNIKGFGKIFRGEVSASKALSGPIGIARMFGGIWDWSRFWLLTGLLSMVLAFMNALPIPALDGGHSVILLYEIVSGRKPSDKFLENAQKVGMVLLLGLMAFAIFNDFWKVFF